MNRQTAFMVGLSAILFARSIPAQTSSADSLRRVALASYDEKNYPHSATAYAALARLPDVTAVDLYNAACSFALAGNIDQAFHYLERAITNGFDAYTPMRVDPDLTAVRADKRWRALASRIDEKEREKAKILASLPNATKPLSTSRNAPQRHETLLNLIWASSAPPKHGHGRNRCRSRTPRH